VGTRLDDAMEFLNDMMTEITDMKDQKLERIAQLDKNVHYYIKNRLLARKVSMTATKLL